jgi:hypothetical protein
MADGAAPPGLRFIFISGFYKAVVPTGPESENTSNMCFIFGGVGYINRWPMVPPLRGCDSFFISGFYKAVVPTGPESEMPVHKFDCIKHVDAE